MDENSWSHASPPIAYMHQQCPKFSEIAKFSEIGKFQEKLAIFNNKGPIQSQNHKNSKNILKNDEPNELRTLNLHKQIQNNLQMVIIFRFVGVE